MKPAVNIVLEEIPFAILEAVKARILKSRQQLNVQRHQPSTRPRAQFRAVGANSKQWRQPQYATNVYSTLSQPPEIKRQSVETGWYNFGTSGLMSGAIKLLKSKQIDGVVWTFISYPGATFRPPEGGYVALWYKYQSQGDLVSAYDPPPFLYPDPDNPLLWIGYTQAQIDATIESLFQQWKPTFLTYLSSFLAENGGNQITLPSSASASGSYQTQNTSYENGADIYATGILSNNLQVGSKLATISSWTQIALPSFNFSSPIKGFYININERNYVVTSVSTVNYVDWIVQFAQEDTSEGLLSYAVSGTPVKFLMPYSNTINNVFPAIKTNTGSLVFLFPGSEF